MYQWIVLLHVVGAFLFVASHGVAMWMISEVPKQRDSRRVAAMLDLSSSSLAGVYLGLLFLLVGGVWAGIAGDHFGRGWIWAATVVLVAIMVVMYAVATPFFKSLRVALGQRTQGLAKDAPDPTPLPEEEILAIAARTPVAVLTVVGFLGLVVLLWLMVLKPF